MGSATQASPKQSRCFKSETFLLQNANQSTCYVKIGNDDDDNNF